MKRPGAVVYDGIFVAVLVSGLIDSTSLVLPPHLERGGHWNFLTNVSLVLAIAYISINIFPVNKRFVRYFHHAVANLQFNVTVAYWSLLFLFPSYLNSDSFDLDYVLDVKIHLLPYVYMLLDCKGKIPFVHSVYMTVGVFAAYVAYIEYVVLTDVSQVARPPYPFLYDVGFVGRALRMMGFVALSLVNWVVEELKQ